MNYNNRNHNIVLYLYETFMEIQSVKAEAPSVGAEGRLFTGSIRPASVSPAQGWASGLTQARLQGCRALAILLWAGRPPSSGLKVSTHPPACRPTKGFRVNRTVILILGLTVIPGFKMVLKMCFIKWF